MGNAKSIVQMTRTCPNFIEKIFAGGSQIKVHESILPHKFPATCIQYYYSSWMPPPHLDTSKQYLPVLSTSEIDANGTPLRKAVIR